MTLQGDQLAAAQLRGAQGRGGRLTLPHRSAGPQQPACSRCAGDGKPRALPRGIAWRPLLDRVGDGLIAIRPVVIVAAPLVIGEALALTVICAADGIDLLAGFVAVNVDGHF